MLALRISVFFAWAYISFSCFWITSFSDSAACTCALRPAADFCSYLIIFSNCLHLLCSFPMTPSLSIICYSISWQCFSNVSSFALCSCWTSSLNSEKSLLSCSMTLFFSISVRERAFLAASMMSRLLSSSPYFCLSSSVRSSLSITFYD